MFRSQSAQHLQSSRGNRLKRKLIEVSLPLEAINRESAREKEPFTRRHPRALHIWWARRPLTAARAVLFAQLVDDPSSHPEEFPTEEEQKRERARLHDLIERLAVWENTWDTALFEEARREILRSNGGAAPALFDPFAGGGTIPLEAQRLGLKSRASDLNPVAVLINKALIDLPPRFKDRKPVYPGAADTQGLWAGADGLATDVREYGAWLFGQAERRAGGNYPLVAVPGGSTARAIGWIWCRAVACPNPACGATLPLVRSWWLSKKKGKEAFISPSVVPDPTHPSGRCVEFTVVHGAAGGPKSGDDGTVNRVGATCLACHTGADLKYVRAEGIAGRIATQLMAVVAEGNRRRIYVSPSEVQSSAAAVARPSSIPDASIPPQAPSFRVQAYGMTRWTDLFTDRQLSTLSTFSDLVAEARTKALEDGADPEYADAIATYLGLAVSRYTDMSNALCSWNQANENVRALFARQAVPMTWDFVEANPFGQIGLAGPIESVCNSLYVGIGESGSSAQASATDVDFSGYVVSTDPPYYDNIGYSDLSDFFYVWLRRSLRDVHPELLSTMLVPKADELVANPYRHDGRQGARRFFEEGFRRVFANARQSANTDVPVTVYYAFKQSETDPSGEASTGWETLLEGMIWAGWEITSTWPIRSERTARSVGLGTNALASSIVLSLRPRPDGAPVADRREYIDVLRDELPIRLRALQQADIAPVDLAQSAIGPGIGVFSRFAKVVEPNGDRVTVREALRLINVVLSEVLSDQEVDFDTDTRWCVKWFETHGFDRAGYGEAETLASAYNTSVGGLDRSGAVHAKAGEVRLLTTVELPSAYRPERDEHITLWEVALHLVKALDETGLAEAGRILEGASNRVDVEAVKELAYLVFAIAEKRSMAQVAGMFNALVTSWPEVNAAARAHASSAPNATEQAMLALDDELGD
ncbi:conserved hypothetical protein [Nostocoides australiense Ben110]|uniref:DUF1156 domain-containing protein n=1 Tax=Nostocoides australiense Ben110 TaxID=1193182 RepID=W6K2R0_9MICO|nr:conserved hypothetical protein [Tetrasphaera australiensis Ben110]